MFTRMTGALRVLLVTAGLLLLIHCAMSQGPKMWWLAVVSVLLLSCALFADRLTR